MRGKSKSSLLSIDTSHSSRPQPTLLKKAHKLLPSKNVWEQTSTKALFIINFFFLFYLSMRLLIRPTHSYIYALVFIAQIYPQLYPINFTNWIQQKKISQIESLNSTAPQRELRIPRWIYILKLTLLQSNMSTSH